jgi:release factor glutamine methyltransferase
MTQRQKRQRSDQAATDDALLKRVLAVTRKPPSPIYAPSDDSLLMIDAIAQLPLSGKRVLDVGTGSGILALYCAMHGADVTAGDIDREAIEQASQAAVELGVQINACFSDLFSNIDARFDLILFNPPYLPSLEVADISTDGGPRGTMLVTRFLEELPSHFAHGAEAYLLLSSINDPPSVQLRHENLEFGVVARKTLFFEELQVLRVRLRDDLTI